MNYIKLYQLLNNTFPNNVYNKQSSIEIQNKTLPYVVLIEKSSSFSFDSYDNKRFIKERDYTIQFTTRNKVNSEDNKLTELLDNNNIYYVVSNVIWDKENNIWVILYEIELVEYK